MQDQRTTIPIIQTKLHRPPLSRDLVARPRLTDLLVRQTSRPLTLVSAPAGYGKSTLISVWAEALDCPVAWVSLDEHDSDLAVFISYILAALQTIYPTVGADTWALVQGLEVPLLEIVSRTLINELNQIETDFVLVLDDYHRIRSTAIHDLIETLLTHPPRHLHLVLGTRIDPPISMNALRGRDKVTEIRLQDMRFTEEEAAVLLEKLMGAPVDTATVAELESQSEGWVTGLRLAAMAMRHRVGRDRIQENFSLNNRYVSEYLVSEILSQQSEYLVEQMLKIAILDRFCAELCQDVCNQASGKGAGNAESFILWLEAANLFVVPLDDQGVWFRYHHLFQAILQNELNSRFSADEIAIMHCRASDWFARNGLLEEAVHHALAAQNLDLAAQLVEEQRIDLLFQQQWLRIQNLLKLFPEDFLGQCISLLSLKALVFCYSYNFDALLPTLKQVEYLLAKTDQKMSDQLRMVVESELALMWGFIYFWSADGARSLEKLNWAVEIVPTNHTFVYGHAVQFQILVYQMVGRYREALELAERAHGNVAIYGQDYLARIQTSLMVVYLSEGNLQSAYQTAQLALKLAQENGLYTSVSWALQALGYIHYQWNELETARQYFAQIVEHRDRTTVQAQAQGFFGLARTLHALGETEQALEVSKSAVEWANEVGHTRILVEARAWYDRLALLNGTPPKNLSWTALLDKSFSQMIFIEVVHVSLAAILIARGKPDLLVEAGTLLASLREHCVQTHNVWHLIEIIALEALLFDALDEHQKALAKLEEAIQHACAGGYVRVFVDLGTPMQALLTELGQNEVAPGYINRILGAFPTSPVAITLADQENLLESLTNRESEILELLAQRLTN